MHFQLRRVNLIYGRNELGKTRLVEFLLHSLFHSAGKMDLRPVEAAGRVKVSGLDNDSEVWFSPRSRNKLEDHLKMEELNLPPQLVRLLVVKGAESELQIGYPGGLGRAVLNEFISNQGLINQITDRVPKNTRQAQVLEGKIAGSSVGDLKHRKEILDRLTGIDNLFADIDQQVSGGPLAELTSRLAEVQAAASLQTTARQHFVNRLAVVQSQLMQQSKAIPALDIQHLEADIREETYLLGEITRLQNLQNEKAGLLESFQWLEAALQTYRVTPETRDTELQWLLPVLAGGSVVGSVVFAFLNIPWLAAVFAAIALILAGFAYQQIRTGFKAAAATPENQRIKAEFERRFGTHCNGLTDLQARKNILDREFILFQTQTGQIDTMNRRISDLSTQIDNRLSHWFPGTNPTRSNRQIDLQKLLDKRVALDNALMQVEIDLKSCPQQPTAGGAVEQADFYDPQKLTELETEIFSIQEKISAIQQQKIVLKQRICDITSASISNDLSDLIFSLQEHRLELEKEAKAVTAEILAGIAVTQAMQELRTGEDAALQMALQSPIISNSLKAVTGRYERIDLNGDGLEVSDKYQTFKLAELSTGAREQVLLGLRIGLASRLFAGQPLFLILDDAFQHSDWQRRPGMVDEVLRLAKTGWQIIYLTMDDHLRDLFLEKTPKELGDDFLPISLTG